MNYYNFIKIAPEKIKEEIESRIGESITARVVFKPNTSKNPVMHIHLNKSNVNFLVTMDTLHRVYLEKCKTNMNLTVGIVANMVEDAMQERGIESNIKIRESILMHSTMPACIKADADDFEEELENVCL